MGVRITPTRYALGNGPVAAASCGTVVGGRDLMRTEIMMASRTDREALMGSMEEFIHYEKLIIFKRQLADPSITDERRRMLARLLALEEAKRFQEKDDGHAER